MTTKRVVEFYEENDVIRFRSIGHLDVTAEHIRCGTPTIDHYTNAPAGSYWCGKRRKRVTPTIRKACPPSQTATAATWEEPNHNFRILWDRHCDELGVPRGTTIHCH